MGKIFQVTYEITVGEYSHNNYELVIADTIEQVQEHADDSLRGYFGQNENSEHIAKVESVEEVTGTTVINLITWKSVRLDYVPEVDGS